MLAKKRKTVSCRLQQDTIDKVNNMGKRNSIPPSTTCALAIEFAINENPLLFQEYIKNCKGLSTYGFTIKHY